MRRLAVLPLLIVALAGCGGGEDARPLPETVEGEITQEELTGNPEKGKSLFASMGCNGCHAYEPAGSTAEIGPPLDDVGASADEAGQDVEQYVRSSIVNPTAVVKEGYTAGIMPSYASEDPQDIADLVAFLTQ